MQRYINPKYKDNYDAGYVFFIKNSDSLISRGITFLTSQGRGVKVSHCGIVFNQKFVIEADWDGVVMTPISKYFNNTDIDIFFKKPSNITNTERVLFATLAKKHIGRKYDYKLIAGFLLRFLLNIEKLPIIRMLPSVFDSKSKWICSELVSHCLRQIGSYQHRSPLSKYHETKINPQMLFDSEELWKPWK